MNDLKTDIVIIGGGIVGVSTAMQLVERFPGVSVTVLEKEAALATHQTGHNSGVIHAGVYYAPGSLKARFCREGAAATIAFCREHDLPFDQCGKLIVATNDLEVTRLDALQARCVENGLAPERLDRAELNRLEPRIVGDAAILVRSSGIADYPAITRKMAGIVSDKGGTILCGSEVVGMRETADEVVVETTRGVVRAGRAIVCGGLMADRLMRMCGLDPDFQIIPFRGEYFRLPASKDDIVRHLVYPVPDPDLPFLGVHLTRMIGGYVTVGPNAVLALAREGYGWANVNLRDLAEMAAFPGFWKVIAANARSGLKEMENSIFKSGYLAECRKYCPELSLKDLQPYPAGVRAQAVSKDGALVHDFLVHRGLRSLHVCNAPSPAATSAIPIGGYLLGLFEDAFGSPLRAAH
uniref:L-2-hydroxyglutarate oxidase n=1 Tax=uncultured Caulobacter sp. TaxID=158749 RepID=UPI0025F74327|nr:L-2-hydroxyglutarate oxidase [uncultured Caulobacter sp.]